MEVDKGSVWRKWDLHVHTTFSKGYSGTWPNLVEQVKNAECEAIGINDYFSVEGYKKLLKEIKDDDLDIGERVIFPVVEMRMTEMLQNKHSTNAATHFNFHIIFCNDEETLKVDDIEAFIKSLSSNGTMIGSDYDDKEKLADKKVSLSEVLDKLNSDDKFIDNYLLWLPYDEYGGIDQIDPSSDSWIKENFIRKAHILGSSRRKQIDFFLWKSELKEDGEPQFSEDKFQEWFEVKKPCIKGSDSHSASDIIGKLKDDHSQPTNKYCWIKADLTFDGLKQIVFEPEQRVKIQERKPEEKATYQVIDHITINNSEIFNQKIEFNQNLNSVIGGRSTGKSILLAAIAKKLKHDRPELFNEYKQDYEAFITTISNSIEVFWGDNEVNNDREIEFFEQGYMYELARNPKKLDNLVQDILKHQGSDELLSEFSGKKSSIKKQLGVLLSDLFHAKESLKEKELTKKEIGDKKGIEDEINKLSKEKEKLSDQSITDEENTEYDNCKKQMSDISVLIKSYEVDLGKITRLSGMSIIREDFDLEMTEISQGSKDNITALLNTIKQEANIRWKTSLAEMSESLKSKIDNLNKEVSNLEQNISYIKVSSVYKNSAQLAEIEQHIKEQNEKLLVIERLANEAAMLKSQKKQLFDKVINLHKSYYLEIVNLLPQLSDLQDNLNIIAKCDFKALEFNELLSNAINLKSTSNQNLANYSYTDDVSYSDHIENILNMLVGEEITLKSGYTHQQLASLILEECFYTISYELTYENDSFKKMSDGKKAFVVLKLLLEFSDKKCPILIDQPEDDLDNRAIFYDLVHYIKQKKIDRQIIVATHNPNIVVGGDSENVIVANQHGIGSNNQNNKKFEYISGSLERTKPLDKECPYILQTQGIREHVCLVLEGGDTAFKLREKKYNLH